MKSEWAQSHYVTLMPFPVMAAFLAYWGDYPVGGAKSWDSL